MAPPTRWVTDTRAGHSQWYIERFRKLAAEGADLGGEARFLHALLPPGASVLDAGCGTGRVGAALIDLGHPVLGVDADEALIAAAAADHPRGKWQVGDLSELDLRAEDGSRRRFDGAVLAGNVMTFVAPGTEVDVLRQVAAHVVAGGPVVVGFGAGRGYELADFDTHAAAAGLSVDIRFATWDLRPWTPDADFAVTVLRG
ncbi:methyltransferase domain-containing protein [Mycobacterium sp. MYCO198283]|uniref:class I SAM-dependent methyltransferase n=1 Tax=Mycobacterium sp. MYCO198283 TaxID=2883505 RepID=UPI001E3E24FD|nr:class I SAM-dependent methyltransferase [Mycobacterium sp. MYCO198283]MCG5431299.1 methyltransferase domain-containing protein [Mycobacterium sp. MYCO198283]